MAAPTPLASPCLIVLGGHSGSGKTTVARALAAALGLPLLSKDVIKEALFDSLGWSDRDWSRRLGAASIAVLFRQLEALLAAGQPCVIESIFQAEQDGPRLRALCAQHDILPIELRCVAAGALLVERIRARVAAGERHPGHVDEITVVELEGRLRAGPPALLELGGPCRTLDTTDPDALDLSELAAWVQAQRTSPAAAYLEGMPRKRMAAALLIRSAAGEVLLVEPSYQSGWLLPGGVVEADESPRAAAAREAREELGLTIEPGPLLCVEYRPASSQRDEALHWVVDGGVLDAATCEQIVLPAGELRRWIWCDAAEAAERLDP